MKAFVLAGGQGTRLRSRFGDLPKPLAPLAGRPFLVRQLAELRAAGVRHAVILAGYGAERVREALAAHPLDLTIEFSIEPEPMGTGGALWHARAHADAGKLLIVNGDTLCPCDPWQLEQTRYERGAVGALALFRVEDASGRGRVECTDGLAVRAFVEKDPGFRGAAWVNGGMIAVTPALWKHLPAGPSSLERDVLPGLAAAGLLHGHACEGTFWDIGTPEDFERAERELRTRWGGSA
ncbi:MAG TPA: sugar phosphate nucleotidyltransferase [Candidatus Acidoferrales bacterium]|nr:sugar phosphate nucleotidyltransferase [Candidatus Acidoferrales bacterium]